MSPWGPGPSPCLGALPAILLTSPDSGLRPGPGSGGAFPARANTRDPEVRGGVGGGRGRGEKGRGAHPSNTSRFTREQKPARAA